MLSGLLSLPLFLAPLHSSSGSEVVCWSLQLQRLSHASPDCVLKGAHFHVTWSLYTQSATGAPPE